MKRQVVFNNKYVGTALDQSELSREQTPFFLFSQPLCHFYNFELRVKEHVVAGINIGVNLLQTNNFGNVKGN